MNPNVRREITSTSYGAAADGSTIIEIMVNSGDRLSASGRTSGEANLNLVIEARKRGWKLEEMGPQGIGIVEDAERYEKQAKRLRGGKAATPEFDLAKAFLDGKTLLSTTRDFLGPVKISVTNCGDLVLPTGRIVACDPLIRRGPEEVVLLTSVSPGQYPVLLSVATSQAQAAYPRNACAMLQFSSANPVRWTQALCSGQDPARLKPGQAFGYGVDSGMGCFMDVEAARILLPHIERFDSAIGSARQMTVVTLDPARHLNVISFSTGWGDGSYSSFFGYDASGKVACLVTDFSLLDPSDWLPA